MSDDYYKNVPRAIITSAPKSDRRVICVGSTDHSRVPKEVLLNNFDQRPVMPFPTIGPVVKNKGLRLLWKPEEPIVDEKILYYRGERVLQWPDLSKAYAPNLDFYTGSIRKLIAHRAIKHMERLDAPVLRYEGNGGLLVAGQVVWCMAWGDYTNQEQSLALLPSKDYLRGIVAWFLNQKGIIPPPKPEKSKTPIVDLYSRNPTHYFVPYGNILRDVISHATTGRLKDNWEIQIQRPRFDPYMLTRAIGGYTEYFTVYNEDGLPIKCNPSTVEYGDPIAYAEAVENGYVGTFEEWQWSEFDK